MKNLTEVIQATEKEVNVFSAFKESLLIRKAMSSLFDTLLEQGNEVKIKKGQNTVLVGSGDFERIALRVGFTRDFVEVEKEDLEQEIRYLELKLKNIELEYKMSAYLQSLSASNMSESELNRRMSLMDSLIKGVE